MRSIACGGPRPCGTLPGGHPSGEESRAMRVVVTGGSGRLGGFVIRELLAHGHDVLSLDRVRPAAPPCTAWQVDLTRSGDVYQALVGAEGVVHLAAYQAPDLAPDTETF